MSVSKFLTFFSPHFRLWTWALFMDQITLLFVQKPGKNSCVQFRRLWTWCFLILQREDMLLRLVLLLTEFLPLSLSLSQTYISCFSSLGFQITILNSPTQFLSLTLSFPLAISLSVVSRVSVFLWLFGRGFGYCYSCGYVAIYVCRCERV